MAKVKGIYTFHNNMLLDTNGLDNLSQILKDISWKQKVVSLMNLNWFVILSIYKRENWLIHFFLSQYSPGLNISYLLSLLLPFREREKGVR